MEANKYIFNEPESGAKTFSMLEYWKGATTDWSRVILTGQDSSINIRSNEM